MHVWAYARCSTRMEARGQLGVDSLLSAMWDSRIELRSSPGLVAGTFTCWAMLLVSVRVYVKQTWGKKGEDLCGYCWLQISLYHYFLLVTWMLIFWSSIMFKFLWLFFSTSLVEQDSCATLLWSPLHKQRFLGGVFRKDIQEEFLTQLAFANWSSPFFFLDAKKLLATNLKTWEWALQWKHRPSHQPVELWGWADMSG